LGLLVLAGLVGCASGPKTYEIKGEADPMINKDISGKPLSVVVRLYQLKDAEEFSRLTFDTLASGRPESELLGQDLLEKNEVILVPGAKYVGKEKLKDDAKYVGVVALFRQPDPHYWRYLVEADKVRAGGLSFKVQDCYLLLANLKPSPIPGQPANATPFCTNPNYRLAIPVPQSGQPLKRGGAPAKSATQIEQWIFNRP
jgi:type VI secretion system protein VasD